MSTPVVSDAAKRMRDQYALHQIGTGFEAVGKWFAVRLSDGSSDGVLYESKQAAVRYQRHDEDFYAFVQIIPHTMTYQEAETYLATMRKMYDAGIRLADRDDSSGGMDMIKRTSREDQYRQLRALFVGDAPPTNIRYRKAF